ncbi:MAG: methionyl-tRNA formyltransferase [Candidatus Pelagibacter sp.]|nr:methionyl-tRNA formyltransferase [Candidatus Pelagibacter sp.]|tara:strand:- start:362 stop:1261 length:900 start_codon:yes stop_codon:yes gene_type:complete
MGTPEFSVPSLTALLDSQYKITCVYTQPPQKKNRGQKIYKSPIHLTAEKFNLKVRSPYNLSNDLEYKFFLDNKPDLVIVVAYGNLIPERYLKIPNLLFLNLHASLLPKWRGAAPIERSILNQDFETGISIMKIVKELDAGPFMLQEKVSIDKTVTAGKLKARLSKVGASAIIKAINLISNGEEKFIDQDVSNSSYAKKIEKFETKINWGNKSKDIIAMINAFNPTPGAWFELKSQRYKILEAEESTMTGPIGETLDDQLTIGTGKNSIKILQIQKEGKNILDVKNFLIGNNIKKGTKIL